MPTRVTVRSLVLACVTMVAIASPAARAQDAVPPAHPTLTNEQILQLRDDLRDVVQALDRRANDVPASTPAAEPAAKPGEAPPAAKPADSTRQFADVADRALDMIAKMGGSIYSTLEKAAPHVWKVMVRQQYVKALSGVVVPLGLLFVCGMVWVIGLHRPFVKYIKNDEKHSGGDDVTMPILFASIVVWIIAFLLSCWFFNRVSDMIAYVVNPEFYAARDMIMMIIDPKSIR